MPHRWHRLGPKALRPWLRALLWQGYERGQVLQDCSEWAALSAGLLWCYWLISPGHWLVDLLPNWLGCGRKWQWGRLRRCSPSRDSFYFLDLKVEARLSPRLLTIALIFLVNVQYKFLDVITGNWVLVEVSRAYAQMQRLIALLLSRSFLEARTFSTESKLYNLLLRVIGRAFTANLNDSLHVTSFCTNEASCYLKFFVIVNLDIEAAGVFNIIIIIIVVWALAIISTLYSRGYRELLIVVEVDTICLGTPRYLLGRLKWGTGAAQLLWKVSINILHSEVSLRSKEWRERTSVSKWYLSRTSL